MLYAERKLLCLEDRFVKVKMYLIKKQDGHLNLAERK